MSPRWRNIGRTSDLYVGKSTLFKTFLLIGMALISAVFVWYTFNVIDRLQEDTRDQVEKYVRLWQLAANSSTSGGELQFIFDEIIVKARFPIIVLDENHEPVSWRNIEGIDSENTTEADLARLKRVADQMYEDYGEFPLQFAESYVNYLRYGDSEVIVLLKWMPFVEIGIVFAFLIVGMVGFQSIRRSEERYIWVGMAKETAHQLGTPLSSLLGWLEVISAEHRIDLDVATKDELLDKTIENMKVDVTRLQRVANRFGLIGSIPELTPYNINNLIEETAEYYRRRLPFEGKGVDLRTDIRQAPLISINAELFGWVLENLVKNSLQAVDPKTGVVTISSRHLAERRQLCITVEDNGRGIPVAAQRKIFRPGFTTKKRGWGMGLTLVARIVEEYHGGRIVLLKSRPGETVFQITLPVS